MCSSYFQLYCEHLEGSAMFLGSSSVVQEEVDHKLVVESQNSQAALFVCNKINSEVKNLRLEVTPLRSTINDLQNDRTKNKETWTNITGNKLPKGLFVSM